MQPTKASPLYYVERSKTGSLSSRVPTEGPFQTAAGAVAWAKANSRGFRAVTVTEDMRGADHPDNAGEAFLYRIIK